MATATAEAPQVLEVLAAPRPLMTAEEFYATCLLERAELVNGEVIEKIPPGYRHGRLAASFALRLGAYVLEHGLGEVLTETGYRLSSNPDVVRSPDVSFLAADRVPDEEPDSFFEGPPTLAIEVVSPGDLAGEVEAKVQEYLAAGTLAVWVVHPKTRSIKVRTANETRVYSRTETLSGEPVLPGFEMVVSEILR